jgi:hypothetical protein
MSTQQAERPPIQYASEGSGPLLQRDYWATFKGVDKTPEDLAQHLRAHFPEFSPPETAMFRRCGDACQPLTVGDEMEIKIALLGWCKVRVVHLDACSLTLRTLEGHPEAGRITFGAYRDWDRLAFRIRSRTRQASLLKYLGYLLLGKQLQSRCWINFIWRLSESLGGTVDGTVHVATKKTRDRPSDWGEGDTPTFSCAEAR